MYLLYVLRDQSQKLAMQSFVSANQISCMY